MNTQRVGFALTGLTLISAACQAQRADENATQSAEDAFGTSIGSESVGIYNESDVRGFSPVAAGNVRIEGLYFDQQGGLNQRLQGASSVRVGPTAQGYAFPAPTGIVDYELRMPQDKRLTSVLLGYGPYKGMFGDIDVQLPLGERFSFGAGLSLHNDEYEDGGGARYLEGAVLSRWRSQGGAVEIVPFWSRAKFSDLMTSPVITVAGAYLPPEFKRERYFGQPFALTDAFEDNYGLISIIALPKAWRARVGLFRSRSILQRDFTNVIVDTTPDGMGESIVFADPPQSAESWSGEIRLTKELPGTTIQHAFDIALRAREKDTVFGGSAFASLGQVQVGVYSPRPKPEFQFAATSSDHVTQPAFGVGYKGRWNGLGELTIGVQRVDYRKVTSIEPGSMDTASQQAFLYNSAIAITALPRLAVFGSLTRGLEESGTAPDNALNRNALLPAAITRQRDLGVRFAITPDLLWVVGLFDVRKPYASVDANNVFRLLGEEVHRGVETSLSGKVSSSTTIVVGGVFGNPEVRGGALMNGVGSKPVGQAKRSIQASIDQALPSCDCSLDVSLSHVGRTVASLENDLSVPAFTQVDVGARYRVQIAGKSTLVRVQMTNITDGYGWDIVSSRSFQYKAGRAFNAYVAMDF